MDAAQSLIDCNCTLGEGILWDARDGYLWWVDVPMPSKLYRYAPSTGKVDTWEMDEMIASLAVRENGEGLLIASHGGLNHFDPDTSECKRLFDPEPLKPFNRSNDGAVDPSGRFWLGTMQNNIAPDGSEINIVSASGALLRIDPDLTCHSMAENITISNTVCWSPDGTVMYFADTVTGVIFAHDFDQSSGAISNRRDFARFDRGHPDGSTVDADGYLWNARWDGSCVVRFAPDGTVDRVVEIPAAQVTNCTFGGDDLSTMYVTTARYGLSASDLEGTPEAGNIFSFEPGVHGRPDNRFAG
ncbi:SMP-30/gluconolactonase/LRE family protein [Roseibium album]|uniref:SMP-30/gluconolactonase/LRE family protein n=1 Tax=Roseibium album TaxID=311410 RepID=UPI00131EF12E